MGSVTGVETDSVTARIVVAEGKLSRKGFSKPSSSRTEWQASEPSGPYRRATWPRYGRRIIDRSGDWAAI